MGARAPEKRPPSRSHSFEWTSLLLTCRTEATFLSGHPSVFCQGLPLATPNWKPASKGGQRAEPIRVSLLGTEKVRVGHRMDWGKERN